jgi:hypothetical protein
MTFTVPLVFILIGLAIRDGAPVQPVLSNNSPKGVPPDFLAWTAAMLPTTVVPITTLGIYPGTNTQDIVVANGVESYPRTRPM